MKTRLFLGIAAIALLLVFSGSAFAHHGTAAYDTTTSVTVKGTITDFQFMNPHCVVSWTVKNDKGEIVQYQGELTAPSKLARAGWTKHTLNAGDSVTISGYPGKHDPHYIWIQKLIGPDGHQLPLNENQAGQ